MKILLVLATLSTAAVLLTAAGANGVSYVSHDKVASALAKGGPLAEGPDIKVSCSHRDKAGKVEVHDKETDVMYIVDGEATLVTGGKVVGLKRTKSDQSIGDDITGGEAHHMTKGDVIVVPAGVPHWFKEVPKSVSYYVVKGVKP